MGQSRARKRWLVLLFAHPPKAVKAGCVLILRGRLEIPRKGTTPQYALVIRKGDLGSSEEDEEDERDPYVTARSAIALIEVGRNVIPSLQGQKGRGCSSPSPGCRCGESARLHNIMTTKKVEELLSGQSLTKLVCRGLQGSTTSNRAEVELHSVSHVLVPRSLNLLMCSMFPHFNQKI